MNECVTENNEMKRRRRRRRYKVKTATDDLKKKNASESPVQAGERIERRGVLAMCCAVLC